MQANSSMIPLIIANWKMNFSKREAINYLNQLQTSAGDHNLVIATPMVLLSHLVDQFPQIQFASQDLSIWPEGAAMTGECPASIIKSCGVNYSILGHSERKIAFDEDYQIIGQKIQRAMYAGITPIICLGESNLTRQNGQADIDIALQVKNLIPYIINSSAKTVQNISTKNFIISYEPTWAIGSGVAALPGQISQAAELISQLLDNALAESKSLAKPYKIVYGGSADETNIVDILTQKHISGALLGRSCLNVKVLNNILNTLKSTC